MMLTFHTTLIKGSEGNPPSILETGIKKKATGLKKRDFLKKKTILFCFCLTFEILNFN